MEKKLRIVGQSVEKKDSYLKAAGKALFAADLNLPNQLYGGVFRSKVLHAVIKKFDASEALKIPGVVSVLTSKDIPGGNRVGIIFKDEPVLVDDKVRRYGDAIAVVAAETPELVNEALEAIKVEYEELEAVLTIERAAQEDSPKVHGTTNLHGAKHLEAGDVDEAFKHCDVIVENDYETPMLAHMFIEPDAGLAEYRDGVMTLYSSTQNPHYDRDEVAKMLGIPASRVVNIQQTTGGGFGGKLDLSVQCHCALLAYHTGRPVKMVRTRHESNMVSAKRHPFKQHYKTGAMKDGTLVATDITMTSDTGAYASYGPAVITRAVVHAMGPYEVPNVRVDAKFYYTNNPMAGAFRGFGVPQVAVAHEGQMNALARALNMDPIELRYKNAHRVGTVIATGQKLDASVGFRDTLMAAKKKADEVMPLGKPSAPNKKRGRGVGCMWYGVGNTGLPNPAAAFIEVLSDASVNLMVGCADIGQGSTTVMAQIAAETLGIDYERVHVHPADTGTTPEGGATSASRQTFISGMATKKAAEMARDVLAESAAAKLEVDKSDLVFQNNEVFCQSDASKRITYPALLGELKKAGKLAIGCGSYNPKTTYLHPQTMAGIPYECYAYATTIMDVEVDTETGLVDVLGVVSAHDVGTAVNPKMVEGQIEGGMAMGIGFGIFEKVLVDKGRITNTVFSKYLLPTAMDVPEIHPVIVESCYAGDVGPYGAKGVGEPALIPAIPASASAVENALGVHFEALPITPTDVMRELKKQREN